MPCFSDWYDGLEPGTPEWNKAEKKARAKLRSIKHIVDYYYATNDYLKPNLPNGTRIDFKRQPKSERERHIRNLICHHFECDDVGPQTLRDVAYLLDEEIPEDRAYLAVIMPCYFLLRNGPLPKLVS